MYRLVVCGTEGVVARAATPWAPEATPCSDDPKDEINPGGDEGESQALEVIHTGLAERTYAKTMRTIKCAILWHPRMVRADRGGEREVSLN